MPKKDDKHIKLKEEQRRKAFDVIGIAGIEGLSFASAAELHVLLGVKTVYDVYKACQEGKLEELDGWGSVRQQKIKSSIELSVLWFQGQCKKVKANRQEDIIENMACAIGFDKELMKEIALANSPKDD